MLIALDNVSIAFGDRPLLDRATFSVAAGERVCLIGRNGEGKTTLMRLLANEHTPDHGTVQRRRDVRVTMLAQELPADTTATVYDVVTQGLGEVGALLQQYHHIADQQHHNESDLTHLGELQHRLEAQGGWLLRQRVETVLSRLDLPADSLIEALSGGWRRRVALATALVAEPDILLLDEPTNHLDVEAIEWIEDYLQSFRGAVVFVTHDRALVRRLATRIVELDRGTLRNWDCNYTQYLERKQAQDEVEAVAAAKQDIVLAQEETWIRQGIKARRKRNQGRVHALLRLREEVAQRRRRQGHAKLALDSGERSSNTVITCYDISYSIDQKTLLQDFSCIVQQGDRIGLVGPNGIGKTTLIKLLLGALTPTAGEIRHGLRLQVAYFDQARAQLDPEATILDSISQGRDVIELGNTSKHIMAYLADFLFPAHRARTPIKALSGGERNRVLLARLFASPANVLILDEPTNDLDIETLELLEELLANYTGTLIIVSHDREFLDNVVTACWVFEGQGRVTEYVGGYSDWAQRARPATVAPSKPTPKIEPQPTTPSKAPPKTAQKLSYKLQRELDALPALIETLEAKQAALQALTTDPSFYQSAQDHVAKTLAELKQIDSELQTAYDRWAELDQ